MYFNELQSEKKTWVFLATLICLAGASQAAFGQDILLPRGSVWRYLDTGANPGPIWPALDFEDSSWSFGPAELGYCDNNENTSHSYGGDSSDKHITTYFRHAFNLPDPARFGTLLFRLQRDDGAVVHLNGAEIFRSNMPQGSIGPDTIAAATVGGAEETTFFEFETDPAMLLGGDNVVAVEIHQGSSDSSDISFDLELIGILPPMELVLNSPEDQAVEVSASVSLEATALAPSGGDVTLTFHGRAVTASAGADFTLVALPDTQYYVANTNGGSPGMFQAQTDWILDHRASHNMAFVTLLGDCVNNGDNGGNDIEWRHATNAMYSLEDPVRTLLSQGLPYGIAVGNHDQSPFRDATGSTTFYNQFFGTSHFQDYDYYGGHYGTNNDNHFQLFSASGLDFIIVHLEFDPSKDSAVLQWANNLLQSHSDRRAIIVSHYLIEKGIQAKFGTQGQAVYDALKGNPNLFLMLSGHVPGEGQRTDTFDGHTVHTLLSDYQGRSNGGNGWLRVLTFSPSNNVIRVSTYSPTLGLYETDADSQFVLDYDMRLGDPFVVIGQSASVSSGDTANLLWADLIPGTTYEWYVTATDGVVTTTSPIRTFTTTPPESAQAPDPFPPSVGLSDSDADGLSDAQEEIAGTDPLDPDSVLKITSLRMTGQTIEIQWPSVPGKNYQVYATENASHPVWTQVSGEVPAAGEMTSWSGQVVPECAHCFYSIRVVGW